MSRQMIVGNWKMNGTRQAAQALVASLVDRLPQGSADVVICPPFPHLSSVPDQLAASLIGFCAPSCLPAVLGPTSSAQSRVRSNNSGNLAPNSQKRVEGGDGVLKNHADFSSPDIT